MKLVLIGAVLLGTLGLTFRRHVIAFFTSDDVKKPNRGPLIWSDEFDRLDYGKWTPMITGWRGSSSFQYYANRTENCYVRDGILFLKPSLTADRFNESFLYHNVLDLTKEGCNCNWGGGCRVTPGDDIVNPVQSTRLHTGGHFSFTYGVMEARAKMPKGDWIWPAIWLVPTASIYGSNPRSGEIDLTEVRSNLNLSCKGRPYGRQLSGSTLHWGPDPSRDAHRKTHWEKVQNNSDYSSAFHLFRVEWTRTGFRFFVDDALIGEVYPPVGGFWEMGNFQGPNIWANGTHMAPFDQPFHVIVNVAVGGNMFPDWCVNQPFDEPIDKPWKMSDKVQMRKFWERRNDWYPTWNATSEDSAFQIDYIRVYALE